MSRYQSTTVTIRPHLTNRQLISQIIRDRLGSPSEWVPSSQIQSLRGLLAASTDASTFAAHLERARSAIPGLGANLALEPKGSLNNELFSGSHRSASRRLDERLLGIQRTMATAERLGVRELVSEALTACGYHVRSADGTAVSGVEARRGHTVLLVAVSDGGDLEFDTVGHGGDDCVPIIDEARTALENMGIEARIVRRVNHGNPDGGGLIDRAAGAAPHGDLLTGLTGRGPHRSTSSATLKKTPSRPRQVGRS